MSKLVLESDYRHSQPPGTIYLLKNRNSYLAMPKWSPRNPNGPTNTTKPYPPSGEGDPPHPAGRDRDRPGPGRHGGRPPRLFRQIPRPRGPKSGPNRDLAGLKIGTKSGPSPDQIGTNRDLGFPRVVRGGPEFSVAHFFTVFLQSPESVAIPSFPWGSGVVRGESVGVPIRD